MLTKNVANTLLQKVNKQCLLQTANLHHEKRAIGAREVVGFGVNSMPQYIDRTDFPFPAIRFKEIKGNLVSLREKEKGDWKKLTMEEKKEIYRASFCQTFSEMEAPTGQWKSVLGFTLMGVSLALWIFLAMRKYVERPLPESLSEENRKSQLRSLIDLRANPVTGISSKWDYEKDDWKK